MLIPSTVSEHAAILQAAQAMAAAARTAPKTRGWDYMHTLVVTGEDLEVLACEMERLGAEMNAAGLTRDAANVRKSGAVLLIGVENVSYGLSERCQYCGYESCAAREAGTGTCVYPSIDLGIAIGSAVSVGADLRMDSRVMYSVGKAAQSLGWLGEKVFLQMGIPIAVLGKSPFFDRK